MLIQQGVEIKGSGHDKKSSLDIRTSIVEAVLNRFDALDFGFRN